MCILGLGDIDNQAEIVSILWRKVGIMQSWAAAGLFMRNNGAGAEFHWQKLNNDKKRQSRIELFTLNKWVGAVFV